MKKCKNKGINKVWSPKEIRQLTKDYMSFVDKKIMEKKFNRNFQNIQTKAVTLGLKRGKPLITKRYKTEHFDLDNIVNLYQFGKSASQIGELLNISGTTILRLLEMKGISRRDSVTAKLKYSANENFFEVIDSEEKAYFLGLLYADGCVFKGKYTKIALDKSDIHILESFKKIIESNRSVTIDKRGLATFIISSSKIHQDLTKLGCVERKSLILKFPNSDQVPEPFIKHFIRGFFDGDGGISLSMNRTRIYFTSTLEFLDELSNTLFKQLKINKTKYQSKNGGKTSTRSVFYGKKTDILAFKHYIYDDATVYLIRKFEKFNLINKES